MNRILASVKKMPAFALAALICSWGLQAQAASSSQGAAKSGNVTIASIKGSARYHTGNNVWQPLKVDMVLKAGAVIQTAANSQVDLVFNEPQGIAEEPEVGEFTYFPRSAIAQSGGSTGQPGSVVRINADSILAVDKLTITETGVDEVTDTQLDLRAGQIMFNVKKLSSASKFEIKFPNGVAGIRGTAGSLTALAVVRCLIGSIVMAYVGSDGSVVTQLVTGGQEYNAPEGKMSPIAPGLRDSLIKLIQGIGGHHGFPGKFHRRRNHNHKPTSAKIGRK